MGGLKIREVWRSLGVRVYTEIMPAAAGHCNAIRERYVEER